MFSSPNQKTHAGHPHRTLTRLRVDFFLSNELGLSPTSHAMVGLEFYLQSESPVNCSLHFGHLVEHQETISFIEPASTCSRVSETAYSLHKKCKSLSFAPFPNPPSPCSPFSIVMSSIPSLSSSFHGIPLRSISIHRYDRFLDPWRVGHSKSERKGHILVFGTPLTPECYYYKFLVDGVWSLYLSTPSF